MNHKITVIAATGNMNKLREFREIFAESGIDADVLPAKIFGIEMPEETEETFEGNSMIKAKAIFDALKAGYDYPSMIKTDDYFVIADDSGLCVDALGGAPGVYSARYSEGYEDGPADDEKNIRKLLKTLENVPDKDRRAHFACVISVISKDGQYFHEEGRFEGFINHGKKGDNGFGYDPVFYCPEYGKTSAEMTPEEKNAVSHRGKAVRLAVSRIRDLLGR
jgi:XTP/dITP diphosphohydrolase